MNETVSIQTDAKNDEGFREDVEIGWLSLDEDYACLEASQKKSINQKLMVEETKEDLLMLRKLRAVASIRNNDALKHPITLESFGAMPSADARLFLVAFDRANSVTGAEKSSPAEQDIGGAGQSTGATIEEDAPRNQHDEAVRPDAGTDSGTPD